jgi:hypothetical protein
MNLLFNFYDEFLPVVENRFMKLSKLICLADGTLLETYWMNERIIFEIPLVEFKLLETVRHELFG